jgi:hypothetical protein
MNGESRPPRFLRDRKSDDLRAETEGLLDRLDQSPALETKIRLVVRYIRDDTLKRLERSCETLTRIEGTIDLLRKVNPSPTDAIRMLTSTANHIQVELRRVRHGLNGLLKTLHSESETEDKS